MPRAIEAESVLATVTGQSLLAVRYYTKHLRLAGDDLWLSSGRGVRKVNIQPHHVINAVLAIANGEPVAGPEFVRLVRCLKPETVAVERHLEALNEDENALSAMQIIEKHVSIETTKYVSLGNVIDSALDFLANASGDQIKTTALRSFVLRIKTFPHVAAELSLEKDGGTITVFYKEDELSGVATKRIFDREFVLDFEGMLTAAAALSIVREELATPSTNESDNPVDPAADRSQTKTAQDSVRQSKEGEQGDQSRSPIPRRVRSSPRGQHEPHRTPASASRSQRSHRPETA